MKEAQDKGDPEAQKQIEAKLKEAESLIQTCERQLTATVSCEMVAGWPSVGKGRLQARVKPEKPDADPCITAPDSKYRGAENQLYRVEIHDVTYDKGILKQFTFKWSR